MTTLTLNEIKALSCIAADTREETKEWATEGSDVNMIDLTCELKWTEQQVGGLVSSLEQKGVAAICDWSGDLRWKKGGVDIYFDNLEA